MPSHHLSLIFIVVIKTKIESCIFKLKINRLVKCDYLKLVNRDFLPKFQGLIPLEIWLIDAKDMDAAQPTIESGVLAHLV